MTPAARLLLSRLTVLKLGSDMGFDVQVTRNNRNRLSQGLTERLQHCTHYFIGWCGIKNNRKHGQCGRQCAIARERESSLRSPKSRSRSRGGGLRSGSSDPAMTHTQTMWRDARWNRQTSSRHGGRPKTGGAAKNEDALSG
jgi:hypothetical protein